MTSTDIKSLLHLQPHPREGGWYTRTWQSPELLAPTAFSDARYPTPRRTSTAIYYLLEPHTFSEMHLLQSDEIFHHYLGAPVELLQLLPDGTSALSILGPNLAAGHRPQLVVPRGVWQGSRLLPTAEATSDPNPEAFALLGCTVSPGFEFTDYADAPAADLITRWPHEAALIRALSNR